MSTYGFSAVGAPAPRHRKTGPVLPREPDDAEKASYAWRAVPYLVAALFISSLCVILAQILFEIRNATVLPFAVAVFGAYTLLYLAYQMISLPVNFTGHSFDLATHKARVSRWAPRGYPSVDIFLPICGESIEVLYNTWTGVFELLRAYPGRAYAFVLDDGDSDEAGTVASSLGFTYMRRPVHSHKKAGNLNYAFRRTRGQHIVIFDADFRPRADFLAETLPYLDDPETGIVQTPQFFRSSKRQSWVERAAGGTLEIFYRSVQVSRDRFGSALCVGSNAVYRRAALEPMGGFTEIPYAEDSHTGARRAPTWISTHLSPRPPGDRSMPSDPRRVHATAIPVVLRGDLSSVGKSFVASAHAPACASPLHCRVALEPHDRAAHPDRPPDSDHSARLPAG